MYCKETSKKKDASYQLMGKFVMRDTVVQVDVIPAKRLFLFYLFLEENFFSFFFHNSN
mgnify:CR=1 FL=1